MTEPKQWAIEQHIKKNPKCEWLCTHTKLENLGEQPEDRPITEPTIERDIREAVKDGLANHTGEFANPWIFKGSYSHELLADILNDIMASERLFKNLQALIANKVAKAKIEAFDVAFDCHDYDRLRAYRAELLKEVK